LATRHSDLASSFQLLNVVVWDENRRVKDIPLGKVSLTKNFLLKQKTGIEQWMQMAPAETEGTVTGDVHLEISYYHPTSEIQTHTFSVNGWTSSSLLPSPFKYAEEPFLLTPCLTSSQLWRRETWSPETSTATPIPMWSSTSCRTMRRTPPRSPRLCKRTSTPSSTRTLPCKRARFPKISMIQEFFTSAPPHLFRIHFNHVASLTSSPPLRK